MKSILIIIIYAINIYLLCDIFFNNKSIEYYTQNEYSYIHDTLYNNLKKSIDIFEKHDLKYWATAGTLLGCVRDKKIIDHDDDVDLGMLEKDYDLLLNCIKEENELFQEFKNAGLHLQENPAPWSQIKILTYRDDGDYSKNRIFIDICKFEKKNNKYEPLVDDWKETEWYYHDEIDNLDEGILGNLKIKIPCKCTRFLENAYGDCSKDRCWKIPKKEHDHENEVNIKLKKE